MTNLDPKKNQKNELTEEQLDKVTGGATFFDTEEPESPTEGPPPEASDAMIGWY